MTHNERTLSTLLCRRRELVYTAALACFDLAVAVLVGTQVF